MRGQAASVEGPLQDALRDLAEARARLEQCDDVYSERGVRDANVGQCMDEAGRAVVAAEHVQHVRAARPARISVCECV